MTNTQSKFTRHTKVWEDMTRGQDKISHRDRTRNATDDGEMMDWAEKDFRTVTITMPQHLRRARI